MNNIGPDGGKTICDSLKENSSITNLCIGYKFILNRIKKFNDYKNNKFGDLGAKAISEALKTNETITKLDLGFNITFSKFLLIFVYEKQ